MALGLKPSKFFKEILEFAFELQLDENLQKEKIIENIKEKYLINYF
jgi:tRNA nucleotidyltransferase (CCA-adding enzyme)